ncbi:MAG: aminoacyl-tRNA hydrolase [Alphaproteobacteria bacterium]|nr:aminoacyl-tRNA hydrolase [Alphaproteobacteria bacterium]
MLEITPTISLSEDELSERFIRAPGPGGQNVNKVETAVQLRFDAANSPNLPRAVYMRLAPIAGRRMTRDGVIVITANRFRSQERNRQDARDRLADLIRQAATPPKHRRPTKPGKAAKQRRLDSKKRRSGVKKTRGRGGIPSDG